MRRIAGTVAGLGVPSSAWGHSHGWEGWGSPHVWGMWGAWGIGLGIFMLAFWALIVAGLVLGLRWLVKEGRHSRSDPALDILRQRYARGEIDREEFEAKRRDLT